MKESIETLDGLGPGRRAGGRLAAEREAHVLLVAPVLQPSGAERVVAELARRLPHYGYATSVLCLEDETAPVGAELARAGIAVSGLRISRRRTLAAARGIAAHILGLNLRIPLIVNAHLFHANIAARLALRRLPAAVRAHTRVVTTVQVAERRFRPWHFWFDRLTAKDGACEVCVAKSVEKFQCRKTHLPLDFFRVIENGIDVARFDAVAPATKQPVPGAFRVVSTGRLNPQKDFPTMLRAWQRVAARFPQATLEIAGAGPEEAKLKNFAAALNLERVRFAGFRPDIAAFLDGADLYIQSSAWEGLPLTVMEAMAAGLPVIASAVDGVPEIVENNRTGLLVPPGDAPALAEKIIALLDDRPRALALGSAARDAGRVRFSADRMALEYAALFRELLADPSAPEKNP
jgi:glycosyltransferase involved in cell wall biosynthesis